jgi:CheY-like chemotaxis protein
MTMPRMGGEEVFAAISELQPGVKVILSSGYDEDEALGRFTDPAPVGFLRKPYRIADLEARLNAALD